MRRWSSLVAISLLIGAALASDRSGVFLEVPFVKQAPYACGAASIAMVMQYWHQQADAESIQSELYTPKARGIYAKDLEGYLNRHAFRTFPLRGTWQDLREHLEKGRPLIVALQPGRGDLHYVVVTGLDWEHDIVLKHDPAQRQLLKQHRAEFEKEWKGTGNWTLLALPEETPPSSAP